MIKYSIIAISLLFYNVVRSQTLQTVTTSGNSTSNAIRMLGETNIGSSGAPELVLGVLTTPMINDIRNFIGWKNNINTITDGRAGTLLLQGRSDIPDVPIDFVTGQGTPKLRMRISGNGNIGIGTSTPGYKLDVQDGVINVGAGANNFFKTQYFTIGNTDYGSFPYIGFNAMLTTSDIPTGLNAFTPVWNPGSGLVIRGEAGASSLHFLQRNYGNGTPPYDLNSFTEVLTLTTSGTLGVGTTDTKGYLLAVNGPAIFTKAVVKLNSQWPDYVFSPSYKMTQLDSLEQFIKVNGHLPEVPTAEVVEKDGINLGSNLTLLLKKIEELTLIVIDQNKKIEKLQKERLIESKNH